MTHEIIPFLGLRQPVSSGTHIIAFVLAVLATYLMWRRAHGHFRLQFIAVCFGVSMIFQYAASAAFHALQTPWEHLRFFLLLDLSAIYVLIAGTYTPPLLLLLGRGWRRNGYTTAIWLLAITGIVLKAGAFLGLLSQEPSWVNVLVFLGMAWFSPAIILDVVRTVGFRGLQWALYAALAYTLGLMAEARGGPILVPGVLGPHEVFHIFAVLGTFCHFIFIWNHVLPYALTGRRRSYQEATNRRHSLDADQIELNHCGI